MGKNEYIGDFNNFINYKKYIINTVNCLNQPTNENGSPIGSFGTLLVEKDTHSIHQIFFSDSLDDVYIRRYNSTWTNWRQQEIIVEESLAQNGYIKYASKLLLQWGYAIMGSNMTAAFNISFTSGPMVISCIDSPIINDYQVINSVSTNNFTINRNAENKGSFWFAIGY